MDDVTHENGCLWVIPGSHRAGLIEHADWRVGERLDKQVPQSQFDAAAAVPIVMPAGSASFHHSVLLHKSGANRSSQPRRGLAIHYMSAASRWTHPTQPQPSYLLLRGREQAGCV